MAWLFFTLLLPALASKVSNRSSADAIIVEDNGVPLVPIVVTHPYLAVIGPPPLRFENPAPPPDLSSHPPGAAPPKPLAERTPGPDVILPRHGSPAGSTAPSAPSLAALAANAAALKPDGTVTAPKPPPPPILRDDVAPPVQPEDFLPYFQYPGAKGRSAKSPSEPPPLPRSTATYQETP